MRRENGNSFAGGCAEGESAGWCTRCTADSPLLIRRRNSSLPRPAFTAISRGLAASALGNVLHDALAPLESAVELEHVLEVPPVRMMTVPGFDTAVFAYTTDIPFLGSWGQPLLFGPGRSTRRTRPTSRSTSPSSSPPSTITSRSLAPSLRPPQRPSESSWARRSPRAPIPAPSTSGDSPNVPRRLPPATAARCCSRTGAWLLPALASSCSGVPSSGARGRPSGSFFRPSVLPGWRSRTRGCSRCRRA